MEKLEITGKIISVGQIQKGVSKAGKEWAKTEFVVEDHQEYPHKYCFTVFGTEKTDNFFKYNKVGDEVKVSFDIEAREYNGRWYTDLMSWRVEKIGAEAQQPVPSAPIPTPPPAPTKQEAQQAESELPF